ncbi:MAG TPA: hypothetical protein VNC79_04640, partial [Mycobacteriales bacterium]|nr:hypothetical protein [Mycobacteriales bacterium]
MAAGEAHGSAGSAGRPAGGPEAQAAVPARSSAGLVGLLAEPVRLRVVAALALGATTAADVSQATGLEP